MPAPRGRLQREERRRAALPPAAGSALLAPMARPRLPGSDTERDTDLAVAERRKTRRPRRFKVLIYNDDFTTMDFVVYVLVKHFRKSPAEATHVMLQVHHKGVGVAGVYPKDVAETKVAEVTAEAREHEMPLRLEVQPARDEDEGKDDEGTP